MPAFLLPDLGEGLTEAEIVTWRVQAGDVVTVDQTVVEVETAKAVGGGPVPFAGRGTADHALRDGYRPRHVTAPGHRHRASRNSVRGARRRHAGLCRQP